MSLLIQEYNSYKDIIKKNINIMENDWLYEFQKYIKNFSLIIILIFIILLLILIIY